MTQTGYLAREPRLPFNGERPPEVQPEQGCDLYRTMRLARQFELRVQALFLENLVKGTTHLSLGMEATAAGVAAAQSPDDYTFATYRGHHHALARGAPPRAVLAELLGRRDGLLKGKGGSMHLTSAAHNMLGSYAIVGAHLCIANGAAWASQLRGDGRVAVAFFGDGATNIGAFHEALNLAATWALPVVFVCENNLYMEYTPIDAVTAVTHPAADRASAYGLERIVIDGNDVEAVFDAATTAIGAARDGRGPSLIEAITYRHGGHSRADPAKYRPTAEVEAWKDADPIARMRERLLERGVTVETLDTIDDEVQAVVDDATAFAKASPEPAVEDMWMDLWADGGSSWRN